MAVTLSTTSLILITVAATTAITTLTTALSSRPAGATEPPAKVTLGQVNGVFYGESITNAQFPDNLCTAPDTPSTCDGSSGLPTPAPGNNTYEPQPFPDVEFNPPDSWSGCTYDGDDTEFNDVIVGDPKNPCAVDEAQSSVTYDTDDHSWSAIFTSELVVSNPGDISFQMEADDGFMFGVGPDSNGATPTRDAGNDIYVPGDDQNCSETTAFPCSTYGYDYEDMIAHDGSESVKWYSGSIHFPSAGVYPVEIDYFEVNGAPQELVLADALKDPLASGAFVQGSSYLTDAVGQGSHEEANCTCTRKDPVNVTTGDFYDTQTYLQIPGTGVPLDFTPTYDASVAQEPSDPADMGPGWTTNYSMSLDPGGGGSVTLVDADGYPDPYTTIGSATVTDENGAQVTFYEFPAGDTTIPAWCTSNANTAFYCPSAPRILAQLSPTSCSSSITSSWTLVREVKVPETYCFTSSGILDGVIDANGNTLTSTSPYSPGTGQVVCPSGDTCTAWTSSASGQSMVLAYNSGSQLVKVFDAAVGGQSLTLSYSGTGCAGYLVAELCSITGPGALSTTFQYATGTSNMTVLSPSTGSTTTNTYYTSGSYVGRIDTQVISGPTSQETVFSYASIAGEPDGEVTTVDTYANGGTSGTPTQDTYTSYGNVVMAQTDGNGVETGVTPDSAVLLPDTSTDGNGNVTTYSYQGYESGDSPGAADVTRAVDPLQDTTETEYNSMNEPWCQVDAAEHSNFVGCPSTQLTTQPAPGAGNRPSSPCTSESTSNCLGATLTYYDPNGNEVAQTDPLGNTKITAYTSAGLPYCTVDAVEYTQNGITCPTPPTSPPTGVPNTTCPTLSNGACLGATLNYYGSNGDLLTTTTPTGGTTTDCYFWEDASGQCAYGATGGTPEELYSVTDPDGDVTTYTYNSAGQVTSQVESYGSYVATTIKAYDSEGRLYCTISPRSYAQGYTSCPSPPSTLPAPGSDPWPGDSITMYASTSSNQVVATIGPTGGVTQSAYDGDGNEYCTINAYNYQFDRTPENGPLMCPSLPLTTPTVGSDDYLGMTIDQFDGDGRVTQETNPLGGITLTTYDDAGNVQSTTVEATSIANQGMAPNVVTSYTYTPDNQVQTTTVDSGGHSGSGYTKDLAEETENAYDPNGDVYCTVSADEYAADAQCPDWNVSWISSPPTPNTEYCPATGYVACDVSMTFYDDDGNVVQSSNADGDTTVTAYDPDGHAYCSVDPTNVANDVTCPAYGATPTAGTTATTYDADGNELSSVDPMGDTTTYTYDAAGNKTSTTNPDGATSTACYGYQNGPGQCAESTTGGSWDAVDSALNTTGTIEKVDCPTAFFCAAVDSVGYGYTYTPTSGWVGTLLGGKRFYSLDCPTASLCFAGDADGNVYAMTASGWSTSAVTMLESNKIVESISCAPPSSAGIFCVAVNSAGNAYAYTSAAGWSTSATSVTSSTLQIVDCLSPTFCATVSSAGVAYVYNGTSWTSGTQTLDSGVNFKALACASTTLCVAGDYDGYGYVYNGTSWSNPVSGGATLASSSPTTIDSAACALGSGFCMVGDASGRVFTYTGSSFSAGTTVDSGYAINAIACVTAASCEIVDSGKNAFTYNGNGYSSAQPIKYAGESVSCPTTLFCAVAEATHSAQIFHGSLWESAGSIDNGHQLQAVSCAAISSCQAVDNNGNAVNYEGSSAPSADVDSTTSLSSISCPSINFCAAGDASGNVVVGTGLAGASPSWSTASVDPGHNIGAMSCASSTFCFAGSSDGKVWNYYGSGWNNPTTLNTAGAAITGVSCVASGSTVTCAASDASGKAYIYSGGSSGGSWTSGHTLGSGLATSTSCPTTSECVAVNADGRAYTYSGGAWSSTYTQVTHATTIPLDAVSCSSASYCVAVDSLGNAYTFNGASWSGPANVADGTSLASVSCVPSLCVAVDGSTGSAYDLDGAVAADQQFSTTGPPSSANPGGPTTVTLDDPSGDTANTATDAGDSLDYYDPNGDLTATDYVATTPGYSRPGNVGYVAYTYNQDGSRSQMTDGTGQTNYTYDDAGDVLSEAFSDPSSGLVSRTMSYTYANEGTISSVTYPAYTGEPATPTVNYGYDADGQMTQLQDWNNDEVTFGHDADNNQTNQGNGTTTSTTSSTTWNYDAADQMLSASTETPGPITNGLTTTGGTSSSADTVANILGPDPPVDANPASGSNCPSPTALTVSQDFNNSGYPRTPDGLISQDTVTVADNCSTPDTASLEQDYTYNAASQVIYQGNTPGGSDNFSYDPMGTPTSISTTINSPNQFVKYGQVSDTAGEVLSEDATGSVGGDFTYTYDSEGDRITYVFPTGVTTYGYDQLGHMTSRDASGTTTYFSYSGDGLEIAKTTGSSVTQLTWSPNSSLPLLETNGIFDFIYGPGNTPVEQFDITSSPPASNPTFLNFTPDDSTYVETNASGQLTNLYGFDAFGSLLAGQTPGSPFEYAGDYAGVDNDMTTVFNMRARWYDARTGEFTTVDPLVSETDQPYEYAGDDPVNESDPSGDAYWWQSCQAPHGWDWVNPVAGMSYGLCGIGEGIGPGGIPISRTEISNSSIAFDGSVFSALGLETGSLAAGMPKWGDENIAPSGRSIVSEDSANINPLCGIGSNCGWVYGPIIQLESDFNETYGLQDPSDVAQLIAGTMLILAHDLYGAASIDALVGSICGQAGALLNGGSDPSLSQVEQHPNLLWSTKDNSVDWVLDQITLSPWQGFSDGATLLQQIDSADGWGVGEDIADLRVLPAAAGAVLAHYGYDNPSG